MKPRMRPPTIEEAARLQELFRSHLQLKLTMKELAQMECDVMAELCMLLADHPRSSLEGLIRRGVERAARQLEGKAKKRPAAAQAS